MRSENKNLAKNIAKISLATFLSRISGLLRDIVSTYFFGTTYVADAFRVAFLIPNMLRLLFGEGALSAAFIPIYNEFLKNKSKKDTIYFTLNILSILLIFLTLLTFIGILVAPLIVKIVAPGFSQNTAILCTKLTRILFPYIFLIGLTSIIIAILNSHNIFFIPSLSPVMLNFGMIITVSIYALSTNSTMIDRIYFLAFGVLIGGFMQLIVNIPLLVKIGYKLKFFINLRQKEVHQVWTRMIPGIVGLAIRQVNLVVDTLLASLLVSGSIAALGYGGRLMQLPLGVFGIAISTAVLPLFSKHTANNDDEGLRTSLQFAMHFIVIIMLPIIAVINAMGKDFIMLLFYQGEFNERALRMTYNALAFYSIGLVSFSGVRTLAPVFYAKKDTKTPVKIAIISMTSNIFLNIILMHYLQLRGLALATSLSSTIQLILLWILLNKKYLTIELRQFWVNFLKILFLSIIISIASHFLSGIFVTFNKFYLLLKILVILMALFSFYIAGLYLMKVQYIDMIKTHILRKFK